MNHAYLRYPTVTELSDFLNTEYVRSLFLTSSIWNVVCNFDCKTFRSFVWSRKWTVNERFEARPKKRKTDFEKNHSFAVLTNLTFLMFKLTIFPSSFPSAGSARLSFFFFFFCYFTDCHHYPFFRKGMRKTQGKEWQVWQEIAIRPDFPLILLAILLVFCAYLLHILLIVVSDEKISIFQVFIIVKLGFFA